MSNNTQTEREIFNKWYKGAYGVPAFLSNFHSQPNGPNAAMAWSAWKASRQNYTLLVEGCYDNGIDIVEECTDGTGPWVRNLRAERVENAANEVLRVYMPQFNDSRTVDDCLVGLAVAVANDGSKHVTTYRPQGSNFMPPV
jgi:hypothetical protein